MPQLTQRQKRCLQKLERLKSPGSTSLAEMGAGDAAIKELATRGLVRVEVSLTPAGRAVAVRLPPQ